ncbi:MAG: class C sortase [Dorea sp.]
MQNKKWSILWIAVIFLLIGIGVFCYPMLSNYRESRLHENVIQGYEESVTSSNRQKVQEEWIKANEYNQKLRNDYSEILNIEENGVMGYIEIPEIDVRLPIYHGSSEKSLEKGVGHIKETAVPVGGKGTHCVLTGHRGIPSAELFTRLDELKEKDQFYIHVLDQILAYEVDQISTVLPEKVEKIQKDSEQDYVTLVTCTPYGVNSHRLLVRGKRTEYVVNGSENHVEKTFIQQNITFIVGGISVGIIALLTAVKWYLWKRRRQKRRRRKKD